MSEATLLGFELRCSGGGTDDALLVKRSFVSRDLQVLKALLDAHPEAAKEKHPTEAAPLSLHFSDLKICGDFRLGTSLRCRSEGDM